MNKFKHIINSVPYGNLYLLCIYVIYNEILFHLYHFGIDPGNLCRGLLFSVAITTCFSLVTFFCPLLIRRILHTLYTLVILLFFGVQFIYHSVFNNFFSLVGTLQYTNQAADNADTVLANMATHWPMVCAFLLPAIAVLFLIWGVLDANPTPSKKLFLPLGGAFIAYGLNILLMAFAPEGLYRPFDTYTNYSSVDLSIQQLGVTETLLVDLRHGITTSMGITGNVEFATAPPEELPPEDLLETSSEEASTSQPISTTEEPIDTSPNIMDLDFEAIGKASENKNIQALCTYFSQVTPTNKNAYTGMFEGYNVIWITAEGFSQYALESDLYPTLSMMANEGFVFEQYYSPLWYGSTLGGEYANLMGNMPKNGGYLSMSHAAQRGNAFPFTMGNQLSKLGYATYAFHNNSSTYYDRNISHPMLGYEWIANGTGLEPQAGEYGSAPWPQSDLIMVQDTLDTYTAEEPFHLYYLTVSGHVIYSFGGNAMSKKHAALVEELPYSDTVKAYLACQYELELAVAEILEYLKANDLYENTLIVLAPDHVPYNNMEMIDELAGRDVENSFEEYRNSLIIWSGSMTEPVQVDKVCSSIDILPTVSNLMGLEYDSRLFAGRDILSDSPGLVMFANRSFITDTFSYNASTGLATDHNGNPVTDAKLKYWQSIVSNRFTAADNITEYNFYQYVTEE